MWRGGFKCLDPFSSPIIFFNLKNKLNIQYQCICVMFHVFGVFLADFPECSCDRRGTEVTQCPLGSPCFCDQSTGQCPCRTGVMGVLCDECEDGYWNLDGASGCQPCSCDSANSFSNICNKARRPPITELHTLSHDYAVQVKTITCFSLHADTCILYSVCVYFTPNRKWNLL